MNDCVKVIALLACATRLFAAQHEQNLPNMIDSVRPAVVKILVHINPESTERIVRREIAIPADLQQYFASNYLIVGTGFFVNADGDVITADHVVDGFQSADGGNHPGVKQIQDELRSAGIDSELRIGVAVPNVETPGVTISSATIPYPASVIAPDPEHDLALVRPSVNPFDNPPHIFGGAGATNFPKFKPTFVKLAVDRPRDADAIFACGYPLFEAGLVTTSGTVASAWNTQILLRAQAAGFNSPQEVYNVDLRINPGNSGGPVFQMSDGAVIGVAVQSLGSLGIAVPAKSVEAFLRTQGRPWTPSRDNTKTPKKVSRAPKQGSN
jgi:S1-C subfamily serine protease